MFPASTPVDSSQRVSILVAASSVSYLVSRAASTDKVLSMVQYEPVATVLRQCEIQRVNVTRDHVLNSNAAPTYVTESECKHKKINHYARSNHMRREQATAARYSSPCRRCGPY